MRELWPFLRDLRAEAPRLAIGTTLLIASLLAAIGLLGLAGWFIAATAVAGLTGAFIDIYRPSAGIRFFALTRTLSRYAERLIHHDAVLRALARLRGWLFAVLAPIPLEQLGRWRRSDLLNRMTADVEALDNLYLRVIGPTFAAVVTVLITVLVLGLIAGSGGWAIGGVLIAGGLLLPALAWRLGFPHGEAIDRHLPQLRGAGLDTVQGLAELRACGAVARHEARLLQAADRLAAARARATRLSGAGEAAVGLLGHAALGVALLIGIGLFQQGQITGPTIALLALAALAAGEALNTLPGAWLHLGRTQAAARRLLAVAAAGAPAPATNRLPVASAALPLVIDGVTFRHAAHTEAILHRASLQVAAGETILLHGPSGAGKSTLLDLIAGLRTAEAGTITLGGVDVQQLPEAERFARLSYLTQRTELFADTVAGNLLIAAPDADTATLWAALERVDLAERFRHSPAQLNAWVGEAGSQLSGGEARRLALARLVLADAPVVLLDEPFRGLDAATAARVAVGLAPWLAERTALIVSHTPDNAPHHDRRIGLAELQQPIEAPA